MNTTQTTPAAKLNTYPQWYYRYSNEDFDRRSALASELAKNDRAAGKPEPKDYKGYDVYVARAKVITNLARVAPVLYSNDGRTVI
jgi:hypothetical protein